MLKLSVFDLEGPLSPADHAALASKRVGEIIGSKNFEKVFEMLSKYDDYLVENPEIQKELNLGEYNPGDTLRLIAPFLAYYLNNSDLVDISNKTKLTKGARETIYDLKRNNQNIFVISTSYQQHAYNISSKLDIDTSNVFCTKFDINKLKEKVSKDLILELQDSIFQKYKRAGIGTVLGDLNTYFWMQNKDIFSQISVCGGANKARSLQKIINFTSKNMDQVMVVGDSITDMFMLKDAKEGGGFAISFNGNNYSTKNANIVVVSPTLYAIYLVYKLGNFKNIDIWQDSVGFSMLVDSIPKNLISKNVYNYFKKLGMAPIIYNLDNASNSDIEKLIKKQKEMRLKVRGWAGSLS